MYIHRGVEKLFFPQLFSSIGLSILIDIYPPTHTYTYIVCLYIYAYIYINMNGNMAYMVYLSHILLFIYILQLHMCILNKGMKVLSIESNEFYKQHPHLTRITISIPEGLFYYPYSYYIHLSNGNCQPDFLQYRLVLSGFINYFKRSYAVCALVSSFFSSMLFSFEFLILLILFFISRDVFSKFACYLLIFYMPFIFVPVI